MTNTQGQRRTYEEAFGNDNHENNAGRDRTPFRQAYVNVTTPLSNTATPMAMPYSPAANQLPLPATLGAMPDVLRDNTFFRPLSTLHQQQPATPWDGNPNTLVQQIAEVRACLSAVTTDIQLLWLMSGRGQ